ncbi:coiled-coil domain-containing protein 190-like [Arapaima gigas]
MHRTKRAAWPGDVQRHGEKRVEARLARGLRQLEEACHYHIRTLTREQCRLTRDLGTIKTGDLWRKNMQNLQSQPWVHNPSHQILSYRKTVLPIIPQSSREPNKHRAQKPVLENVGWPSTGLQTRVRDFIDGRESKVESSVLPVCLPDLKGQNVDMPVTTEFGKKCLDDSRTAVNSRKQAGEETHVCSTPPGVHQLAPDGKVRTIHTLPSFAQALTEARKARYLRLRGRPLCEQELSVREIFSRTPTDN